MRLRNPKLYLLTLLTALFIIPQPAAAAKVRIGGLNYILNPVNNTAEVTYITLYSENREYVSGDLTVPSSVEYDGQTYTVTDIGYQAFHGCENLTSVTIPNSVYTINAEAFIGCDELTTVTMANSVTEIGSDAFAGCDKLATVTISDALSLCSPNPFPSNANIVYDDGTPAIVNGFFLSKDRKRLFCLIDESITDVTIPNSVTTICNGAFKGRGDLTSVTIPNSVTKIGTYAFENCTGLTEVTIPNSVTEIGGGSFLRCSSLTSVTIPNSVTKIGGVAFGYCSSLTSVTIPNSVTKIGGEAFGYCSSLTSLNISNAITEIEKGTFISCSSLTSVVIPNSVVTIGVSAFQYTGLKSVTIPQSVKEIGGAAFIECSNLSTIYHLSDSFNKDAFDSNIASTIYCHPTICNAAKKHFKGKVYSVTPYTLSLTSLICGLKINVAESDIPGIGEFEKTSDKVAIFDENNVRLTDDKDINKGSEITFTGLKTNTKYKLVYSTVNSICSGSDSIDFKTARPRLPLTTETHQTSIIITELAAQSDESAKPTNLKVALGNDVYDYKKGLTIKNLKPGTKYDIVPSADYNGTTVSSSYIIRTDYLRTNASFSNLGPTTVTLKGTNNSEAKVIEEKWLENGQTGNVINLTGLDPKTQYKFTYQITTEEGTIESDYITFTTSALTLTTLQPRCATASTAIVAAETNISDTESNVGFQWRKYDAPESLKSNEGYGAVYDGVAEGYLRNLQSVYYNVRAFYKSASGNGVYYYSDWVTFDPTDFSYFEPTVHTYPVTSTNDFNATLKGYVMNGSDEIKSQGFEYWPTGTSAKALARVPVNSTDVQTVFAKGQVMVAEISGLLADTEYTYRAFAETTAGIIYGEEQTFRTTDTSGVESITIDKDEATIIGYYDLSGCRYDEPRHGLNIIVYSNGKVEKTYIR